MKFDLEVNGRKLDPEKDGRDKESLYNIYFFWKVFHSLQTLEKGRGENKKTKNEKKGMVDC